MTSWMRKPRVNDQSCPPGLEYLTVIDQILIQQESDVRIGKYRVTNKSGQDIYIATECSTFNSRVFFGSQRHLDMEITDNTETEVIHLCRPYRWCFPFGLQLLQVSAPVGERIGFVVEERTCSPSFAVQNANKETVFRITGPLCVGCGHGTIDFQVLSLEDRNKIGNIRRRCRGWVKDLFTGVDYIGISFPMDLDVRMKAVMMGACFLIHFMYFEF